MCYSRTFALDSAVAFVDGKKNLRIINAETGKTISGVQIPNIKSEHFGVNSKMMALSENKVLIGVTDVDEKVIYVYNIPKHTLAFKVTWHKGMPDTIAFDPLNRYMATGGQDGKLCLWFFATGRLAFTVTAHQDFVSAIAFDSTGKHVASASYDKTIVVISVYTMNTIAHLKGYHTTVITRILFIPDSDYVITADRRGKIILWDYVKEKYIATLLTTNSQPSGLCIFEKYFLFVGSVGGHISVYHLEKMELVDKGYIYSKEGIRNICYIEKIKKIILVTAKKDIFIYDPLSTLNTFSDHIASGEYQEAYELVGQNQVLKYFKQYAKLESIWQDAWKEALQSLEGHDSSVARQILSPFVLIPEKSKSAQELINSYKEFQKFKLAIEKKNYQLAYSVLNSHAIYKDSATYEVMEEDWQDRVSKAMKLIEHNAIGLEDKLKTVFSDFRGISQKLGFIRGCQDKKNVLSMFNKYKSEEKYINCFDLANKYEFLKELRDYDDLLVYEETLFHQAESMLNSGQWQIAKSYATDLLSFPTFQDRAREILHQIDQTALFYTYLSQKDYSKMINLVSKYTFLQNLQEYKKFYEITDRVFSRAEEFASKGGIKGILDLAGPYMNIKELKSRFGQLLASAYIQQLYYFTKKIQQANSQESNISKVLLSINLYAKIFGIDDNLTFYLGHMQDNLKIPLDMPEDMLKNSAFKPDYLRWASMKLPNVIFNAAA